MGLATLANENDTIEGSAVSVSMSGHLALKTYKVDIVILGYS